VSFKLNLSSSATPTSTVASSSTTTTTTTSSSTDADSPLHRSQPGVSLPKSSAFTPRSMLNKMKNSLYMSNTGGEHEVTHSPTEGETEGSSSGGGEFKKPARPRRGHIRSHSLDTKSAAALVQPVEKHHPVGEKQQLPRTGSSRANKLVGSSSSTRCRAVEPPPPLVSSCEGAEAGGGGGGGSLEKLEAGSGEVQLKKWVYLQRRNTNTNPAVLKKSSTADTFSPGMLAGLTSFSTTDATGGPSTKRSTSPNSEAHTNRIERAQRRRYRIIVSSPQTSSFGEELAAAGADAESDLLLTDSDSEDEAGASSPFAHPFALPLSCPCPGVTKAILMCACACRGRAEEGPQRAHLKCQRAAEKLPVLSTRRQANHTFRHR